jgi:hypothetical protein
MKQRDPGKKLRLAQLAQRHSYARSVTRVAVAILLMGEDDQDLLTWVKESRTLPQFLRRYAKQRFGTETDVKTDWERRVCEIITDIAEREMTDRQWKKDDISSPALVVSWFAGFLEKTYQKTDLTWNSGLLRPQALDSVLLEGDFDSVQGA